MKKILSLLIPLLGLQFSPPTRSAQFQFPSQTLTVPDGFTVEQVAGPGLVDRPICADFDEQGRLYISDSSGSNDKAEKQLAEKPHRIVRLEDSNGDGKFDKSVVFADKMMFPEGCMWVDGSLYVGAPPSIWKLTDTDGDGVADQREEWHKGRTLTGCANDMHGPYLGPDGWIYWAKGAFAEQTYTLDNGKTFQSRAAHIFRKRPDGTGLEAVMTGGMDNPVEVAFLPNGERFFTTTFVHQPQAGKRDGLVHAVYGGLYGKVNDALDGHKKTGDLMPVMVQWGPAAPCGLTRYESRVFGDGFQDNLFACLFNLHKVTRHELTPDGATYKSRETDFVTSDNPDFHPTDVLEDADGSLLMLDTGGWYKICCPTSQLAKPDVFGAVYRIRRKGAPKIEDARGLKLAWRQVKAEELVQRLDDKRPSVRLRAITELARQGDAAVPALAQTLTTGSSALAQRNAIWTLARMDSVAARAASRLALDSRQDATVRLAAIQSAGLWRDPIAKDDLLKWLHDGSSAECRAAAEAIGRIGAASATPVLLRRSSIPSDRVLEHSLIFALIEIGDPDSTALGLSSTDSNVHRAALIALDQMDGGGLKPEQVTPLLASSDPVLKQTALWIVSHHPEWGEALAGFLRERLSAANLSASDRADLQRQLSQFARSAAVQDLLASSARDAAKPARLVALGAMAGSGMKELPASWTTTLTVALYAIDPEVVSQAVATARALPAPKKDTDNFNAALLKVARDPARPDDVRLGALASVPGGLRDVEPTLFDFLRGNIDPGRPVNDRSSACAVIAKARLSPEQLAGLADALKTVGPLELPKLLPAFEKSTNETLGLKLLAALKESKGASGLRAETLKPRLTNFPAVVRQKGDELIASLNTDAAKQKAHLDELYTQMNGGDVRRGQAVFNSTKAACASCHSIGYLGGNIGPDLTSIGQVRTERDLLEAILYPSASFVRSYEPVIVATKSGDEYSGVLRKDATDEILLATGVNTEVRVARADIVEMRPGAMSIMPQGLDQQLSKQELADLLAFLKNTKWGAQ
jgi:putative membrane-bound dehydrogenase-like protein